jgi:hypothetical protein
MLAVGLMAVLPAEHLRYGFSHRTAWETTI